MLCPTDGETLVMTDRAGVEIDYCPKCRGVWLDRGELDKIIERSSVPQAPQIPAQPDHRPDPNVTTMQNRQPQRHHDDDDDDDDRRRGRPAGKREGFLSNLFDF